MTAVIAWVVAPLLWAGLSLGIGRLIQAVVRGRIPTALLLPIGFAGFIVLGTATTAWPPTATLTVPVAVVLAGLGLYLKRDRLRWSAGAAPAVIAAVATYLLYGLPVIVSGSPFAGWIKLDDGASWLGFTDQLIANGRTTEGLAPSTFETLLKINWDGSAYPLGVFPPLGGAAELLHVDAAWLLQPYLAFLAGVLALTIFHLLSRYVAQAALRVGLAVIAATPALLLGYALWGGIKEIALAPLFVLIAVLATRRYSAAALATVGAAVLAISGFSGAAWLILPGLFWLVVTIRWRAWGSLAVAVGGILVLSIPLLTLVRVEDIVKLAGFAASSPDIGNLSGPLRFIQIMGIWPVDDFRLTPEPLGLVYALLALVALLAAVGLWRTVSQRDYALALYVGNSLLIAAVTNGGNAWIAGKALAMSSPALLVAAAMGIGWLWERGRVLAAAGLALVAFGVGWSYVLAYQGVWLAPTAQLEDLRAIGQQDLPGPTLMVDYSPYGARHFLRRLDTEGAGELRRRTIPKAAGGEVWKGEYAEIDDIATAGLADFETLVLRRSVIASRPPSNYSLAWQGEAYEVWRRNPGAAPVLEHRPLGSHSDPAAITGCEQILEIAANNPDRRIAAVERPPVIQVPLAPGEKTTTAFTVPVAGEYEMSLGGSFTGEVTMTIDGQEVFSDRHQLNWTGNVTPAGTVALGPGRHELVVTHRKPAWQPGSRGPDWPLGPLYLSLSAADAPVLRVPAAEAGSLCGRRLDWIEVLG